MMGKTPELVLDLDTQLYAQEVVVRALHRQSTDCSVELERLQSVYRIRLLPSFGSDPSQIRARFLSDLLDESLRDQVMMQTAALRDTLLEAALREASPRQR
jgi:His-Xaa-Ser system protein HxsD